jgi:hypothetical protein
VFLIVLVFFTVITPPTPISFPSTFQVIPATSAIFLSQFSHFASLYHTSWGGNAFRRVSTAEEWKGKLISGKVLNHHLYSHHAIHEIIHFALLNIAFFPLNPVPFHLNRNLPLEFKLIILTVLN